MFYDIQVVLTNAKVSFKAVIYNYLHHNIDYFVVNDSNCVLLNMIIEKVHLQWTWPELQWVQKSDL